MRILAIADEEAKALYDYYRPGVLDEYDLILACGDLKRGYLEFLVTMAHCPLVYVPGNHDEDFLKHPPEGCICADGKIVNVCGIRILGLGGSYQYRLGEYMYTEKEMAHRIFRLKYQLWKNKGFDIMITHAPARHINDYESEAHRGFECFVKLLDQYQPKFFIHGHVHLNYDIKLPRRIERGKTSIINGWEYYAFDYPAEG